MLLLDLIWSVLWAGCSVLLMGRAGASWHQSRTQISSQRSTSALLLQFIHVPSFPLRRKDTIYVIVARELQTHKEAERWGFPKTPRAWAQGRVVWCPLPRCGLASWGGLRQKDKGSALGTQSSRGLGGGWRWGPDRDSRSKLERSTGVQVAFDPGSG